MEELIQPPIATQPAKKFSLPKNLPAILILLAGAAFLGFFLWQQAIFRGPAKPSYETGYRLVNEKISRSAAIILSLPYEMKKETAQASVKFDPEIEGQWVASENKKEIIFKPKEQLELNHHYSAQLAISSDSGAIKSDFLVDEDPKILAVFPKKNSEAPENSEITIVFNRPMVPLTTLDYMESKDVPVEITPATQGRFKWTSTRNLQFIPDERLVRSSNYNIKIKAGLVSMDGLPLSGTESSFVTRKLRYVHLTEGQIAYNQPILIYFNQPVDLEKIRGEISLRNLSNNQDAPFIIEYGTKSSKGDSGQEGDYQGYGFGKLGNMLASIVSDLGFQIFPKSEEKTEQDSSVIQIYNKQDKFGRKKFWDFKNNYQLEIRKAYPLEGDINLEEGRKISVFVSDVIQSVSAESERTQYAEPRFFDPQGKLWVQFYEEINLDRSDINSSKIKEIGYGEKCKDEKNLSQDCEKTQDKKRIYLTFKPDEIGLGEQFNVNFEKVVNIDGLTINRDPIVQAITSYPKFSVLATMPGSNSGEASLTSLIICSNAPILTPQKEDFKKYIKTGLDYEVNYWFKSWRVQNTGNNNCAYDQFQTQIGYGLMPSTGYSLELDLEDVFGQKASHLLSFVTEAMPVQHLNFYHFQKGYNVTSPSKTKLTYAAQNMEYVNLEICKLKPSSFLYFLEDGISWNDPTPVGSCESVKNAKITLPKRYWIKNYFQVDMKDYFLDPIGHYILTFSHPDYATEVWQNGKTIYKNVYERTYLTVTNLAVTEKRVNSEISADQFKDVRNLYWVTNLSSLAGVSAARIDLYKGAPRDYGNSSSLVLDSSYLTDSQGIIKTPIIPNLRAAIISKDGDSTVIANSQSKLNYTSEASVASNIYLYTDKPIYRPSQQVFVKGIHRLGYDGNYEIYTKEKMSIKIYNSRSEEIMSKDLTVSEFGTFDTDLILPDNSPLGSYRICVEDSYYQCAYFDVQEYVAAPFEINVKSDKEEYVSKDTVNLEVDARYYFGVALEGGEVSYTVSSQNYYFDKYSKEYFRFGSSDYWWYPYNYGDKFLLRGKASLDTEGKAKISQVLDFESLFKNKEDRKSKIIVFDVTVQNSQGQSVSSQKSLLVHAGDFYLGIKSDKFFMGKNEKFNVKVKSVDTEGKEKRVSNIALNVNKIDWVYSKRQEAGGGYAYQWEKKKDKVQSYSFSTDSDGNYSKELQIPKEGEYELEVSASDQKNNLVWSSYSIYVWGEGSASIRPTKDVELELQAEKNNLNVGEEGSIIIKSPFDKAKALISIERGKIFDYQIVDVIGNLYNYKFPIKEEYLPNVYVSVLLQSYNPEIKFGQVAFQINTKQKELNIEVTPNKKNYLPGEEVTLDILAKNWQGNPVTAEMSLAVVDLSVLALKGNPKKNPVSFFYGGFPLAVQTGSNIKDILVETEIVPSKGGGGASDESLASKKRGVFRETAFWQAVVITDSSGRAQVKFTLPDNLTTWQAETLGVTKNTELGVNYQEFISRKELMAVPLKPRFVIPGDVFYIGAQIFNQTKDRQKITVKFESSGLSLVDDKESKDAKIDAGKRGTVYFKVQAPVSVETGDYQFVISAKAKNLEDTVEQTIKIVKNDTYETVASSNYTQDKITKEYVFLPDNVVKDKGGLSIKSSATLAVFLSDSLNYLLQFPYGCSEQVSSKLNAIAIVKKGLNLPNLGEKLSLDKIKYDNKEYTIEEAVNIGLAKLYNNQRWDGGFSWWAGGESDFYVTLQVTEVLNNLDAAGFQISKSSLTKAIGYLVSKTSAGKLYYESEDEYKNRIIVTAYTLSELPGRPDAFLQQKIIQIANDSLFINDQISNSNLAYLAMILADGYDQVLKKKIFDTLDNRIDIDSRGAYLEIGKNAFWRYYETPIKNTALYLKALTADKSSSPIMDKVLRWILNSRSKDGAWGSTNNTLNVIDSLTDFLKWKRETESNFTLDLAVNNDKVSFDFKPETILAQFRKDVPLKGLKINEINTVSFAKTDHNNLSNNLYYDMSLKYYLLADHIAPRDEGFSIERGFYALDDTKNKTALASAKVGEVLKAHLKITVPEVRNFVAIEDFIPAGMEIVNLDLATEQKSLLLQEKEIESREFWPTFKEVRDDRAFLFRENIYPGVYEFDYYVRALTKGTFTHLPAVVSEMYFPENFGRTAGGYFEIK